MATALLETTLIRDFAAGVTIAPVASVVGLVVGSRLFTGRETMRVVGFSESSGLPRVVRGVSGAVPPVHRAGSPVLGGPASSFQSGNPVGVPGVGVQPHWVNVDTGVVWVAVGDEDGPNNARRSWVTQTSTQVVGALGVRQTVVAPAGAAY